jgi:NTP pyrophosphatase (non-canonical NTP hydrolase)
VPALLRGKDEMNEQDRMNRLPIGKIDLSPTEKILGLKAGELEQKIKALTARCPICKGEREVYVGSSCPDDEGFELCPACGGTGKLPTPEEIAALRRESQRMEGDLQAAEGELAMWKEQFGANALGVEQNVTAIGPGAARLSAWIDASYGEIHSEVHARRRVDKLMEECGEVGQALGGWFGENPRKGVTHTREDVLKELLDVALTALGAWESLTGNTGGSGNALQEHVVSRLARVGLLAPAAGGEA